MQYGQDTMTLYKAMPVYLYDGNFETDLRLGEAVSETYRGWINPAAFR